MKNKRLIANIEILNVLSKYIMDNPNQRFGQILKNIGAVQMKYGLPESDGYERPDGWVDEYNLEPDLLFDRIKKQLDEYNKGV